MDVPFISHFGKNILRNVGSCFCGAMKLQHRLKVIEISELNSEK